MEVPEQRQSGTRWSGLLFTLMQIADLSCFHFDICQLIRPSTHAFSSLIFSIPVLEWFITQLRHGAGSISWQDRMLSCTGRHGDSLRWLLFSSRLEQLKMHCHSRTRDLLHRQTKWFRFLGQRWCQYGCVCGLLS